MAKEWKERTVDPEDVFTYIKLVGAATTREIKDHFNSDSTSVRRAVGVLMQQNRVWVMASKTTPKGWGPCGIFYLENTGERGLPNVHRRRTHAGILAAKDSMPTGPGALFSEDDVRSDWSGVVGTLVPHPTHDKNSWLAWQNKKDLSLLKIRFDFDEGNPSEYGVNYETPQWHETRGYHE